MSLTMDQANQLLGQITTETELRNLIEQLDVFGTGSITVLYGGSISDSLRATELVDELIATGQDVRVLDNTEAFRFMSIADSGGNDAFRDALERIFNSDPDERGSAANQFLQGQIVNGERIPNGAWDIISENFVEATVGEVRTIVPGVLDPRVFGQTELPALLNNTNITTVDGIDIQDLNAIHNAHGLDGVRRIIFHNTMTYWVLPG